MENSDINKLTFLIKGLEPMTFKELLKLICKDVLADGSWNRDRFSKIPDAWYSIAEPFIKNGFINGKIMDGKAIEIDWNDFDKFITNQLDEFFK